MAKLPRYCYKPLETLMTIRVLVLNAATSVNEPLTCAIEHQQRDSATADYCAISYAWGVPNFTHQLLLSSGADVAHLAITKNVDGLLRQMRSLDIRRLWIDAVCLNQDDKTEKSRQIPEMGAIYRCANMVHIWLGESDEAAEAAFELFKTYGRGNDLSEWSLGGLLREFAERPWFHRRWVIQEACLSRRPLLHCGKLQLPLSALVSATQQLAMNVRTYQKIGLLDPNAATFELLELLYTFHDSLCMDHRDRILALFGLLSPTQQFSVDYQVHWSEMYRQVAMHFLSRGDRATKLQLLLHRLEFGHVEVEDQMPLAPWWVPNWSRSRHSALPFYHIVDVDKYRGYPKYLGDTSSTTLELFGQAVRLSWTAPAGTGLRDEQALTVWDFEPVLRRDYGFTNVLDSLQELYASSDLSRSDLVHVVALLKMVAQAATNDARGMNSGMYSEPLTEGHTAIIKRYGLDHHELIGALHSARLSSRFSICKLAAPARNGGSCNAHAPFAISSSSMLPGDVLIPLWAVQAPPSHPDKGPINQWRESERRKVEYGRGPREGLWAMMLVRDIRTDSRAATDSDKGSTPTTRAKFVGAALVLYEKSQDGNSESGIRGTENRAQSKPAERFSVIVE